MFVDIGSLFIQLRLVRDVAFARLEQDSRSRFERAWIILNSRSSRISTRLPAF
jgi:hypothetical protein